MRLVALAALGFAALMGAPFAQAADGAPQLSLPIACEVGRTCEVQNYVDRDPGPGALDYRCLHRTYQNHNGVDIRVLDMAAQRAGVDVLAAAPGRVARLRDGVADISIHAPGAPSVAGQECGNGVVIDHGGGWETQYCHVAKGSLKVKVGDQVAASQPIAHVGLSGDTEFPHLHFTIRHAGVVVDPFAPGAVSAGSCPSQAGLWTPPAARALAYKRGAVLNVGFETAIGGMEAVEDGRIAMPAGDPPALVAYARMIGLEAGDVVELKLTGPDGKVLADASQPIDRDKAQYLSQAGRKRPAGGWPHGAYLAEVAVRRNGAVAFSRQWRTSL
ncbi:MAG: M23 family metallopeptidase [Proteobacteria bacterium]|nr:M23 family metallopeptidase [Pseudomonadota bacterium]